MTSKIRLFNPTPIHVIHRHFIWYVLCHCLKVTSLVAILPQYGLIVPVFFFQVKEEHFRTYPHWKWCQKDRKKSPRKGSDITESADSMSMLSSFFYYFDYKFKIRKSKSLKKKVIITPCRHFDPALLRDFLV